MSITKEDKKEKPKNEKVDNMEVEKTEAHEGKETPEEEKLEEEEQKKKMKKSEEKEELCSECHEPKEKCKCAIKGEAHEQTPSEGADASNQSGNTISPNAGTPSTQNVFIPQSGINVGRNSTSGTAQMGQSPSDVHYTGKSASLDLIKSPLFNEITNKLNNLQKSNEKKLDSIEKSMNDRIANLTKLLEKVEKAIQFQAEQPLYKGFNEPIAKDESFTKKLKDGQVKYSN
jgi:ATP-dependent Clp protease ATP-binding subunit ClpA